MEKQEFEAMSTVWWDNKYTSPKAHNIWLLMKCTGFVSIK